MKKLLVVTCVVLAVAFLSSFAYTLYFTATHSCKTNSSVQQNCDHEAEMKSLMREIEVRQDRIKDLQELIDFYYDALLEFSHHFEIQHIWIEELLGELLQAQAEIRELEKQIAELQRQLVPANWNGVWGQYVDNGYGYEFEELITIENGIFSFAIWMMKPKSA